MFTDDLSSYVSRFVEAGHGTQILLKQVHDASRYGVADIKNERIMGISEKPANAGSALAVTGIYMYDAHVSDIIRELTASARGEFEITDVNNWYIHNNEMMYDILPGDWMDARTFPSLQRANQLMLGKEYCQ